MSENHAEKIELPPLPMPLLDIPEEAKEYIRFKGDAHDIQARLRHKLILMWTLYGFARNDAKLIDIVNKDHDKDGDLWYVCNKVVNLLDQWARIVITTDLLEELSANTILSTDFVGDDEKN